MSADGDELSPFWSVNLNADRRPLEGRAAELAKSQERQEQGRHGDCDPPAGA